MMFKINTSTNMYYLASCMHICCMMCKISSTVWDIYNIDHFTYLSHFGFFLMLLEANVNRLRPFFLGKKQLKNLSLLVPYSPLLLCTTGTFLAMHFTSAVKLASFIDLHCFFSTWDTLITSVAFMNMHILQMHHGPFL